MKSLNVVMLYCLSVVCAEASAAVEVSGRVGGDASIHCTGSWTTDNSSDNYNMYFCRGEKVLIQTEARRSAAARRGRYSMEVNAGDGGFDVTIKKLQRADAGKYHCGVGKTLNVLYQEVNLIVLNASTAPPPPGSSPSTTTVQTEAETPPGGSSPSSTDPPPAASTLSATEEPNKQAAPKLTDTTVVIIVSVSLALLVCAVIPLIFYGHCRTAAEDQNRTESNKGESDCCEGNADCSTAAVRLQSFEPHADPESSAQDSSQYAAIYQALDPKSLD